MLCLWQMVPEYFWLAHPNRTRHICCMSIYDFSNIMCENFHFFSLSSPSTHIFFIRSHIHHDVVWMDFTHRPTIHINIIIVTHACNGLVQIIVYRFVYNICEVTSAVVVQFNEIFNICTVTARDFWITIMIIMSVNKAKWASRKKWATKNCERLQRLNEWEREPETLMGSILFCDNMLEKLQLTYIASFRFSSYGMSFSPFDKRFLLVHVYA